MAACLVVSVVRSRKVPCRVHSCLPLAGGVRVYLFVFVSIRVRVPPIRVRVDFFLYGDKCVLFFLQKKKLLVEKHGFEKLYGGVLGPSIV